MYNVQSLVKDQWLDPDSSACQLYDASTGELIGSVGHKTLPFKEMLEFGRDSGGRSLREMGFHERAKLIKAVAVYLEQNKKELYDISYNTGATKPDSMIDIDGGITTMLVFASKGRREMPDGKIYVDGAVEELSRDGTFKGIHIATPLLGVAVHINAFNFPVWGMLEKLAPSWLAGVPVIVKPASQTSYLTEAVVKLIDQSGIVPKGAIQMIGGAVGNLFDYLTAQDVVSFTGSEATANKLRSHPNILKNSIRFIGEQDSLNGTILGQDIITEDQDFEVFIKEIIREMTVKAGQKCTAIRRIFVPIKMVAPVIAALDVKLSKMIIGDPRSESTRMGPLVSTSQYDDVLDKVNILAQEAEVVIGEIPQKALSKAAFFKPLLLHCKDPDHSQNVHNVEAFGPVATIMGYTDLDHVALLLNKGGGSLVASVFTNSGDFARDISYKCGPWHGRLYFNNYSSSKSATGHGSPLPHMIHGGPGRAGGGEELGGIRGVMQYMQRTAIQGHPNLLTAVSGSYISGADRSVSPSHPFTRVFEALKIGEMITTEKRIVTLEDIDLFANFTGDLFYAHMDEVAAKANPFFPGRVAHGYLLLSFAAGLFVEPNPGPVLANTGLDSLVFLKPVSPEDEIYATLTVMKKTRRTNEYGEVRWLVEISNQSDERVAQYELLTMCSYAPTKNNL